MIAYINIGSNLGDRHALLREALQRVAARFEVEGLSDFIESEPWGFESEHTFVNVGARLRVHGLTPEQLLDELQAIERSISPASHRKPDGTYADRLIDIDIMHIDGITCATPRLTLPHPHLHDRPFFLIPLRQLLRE